MFMNKCSLDIRTSACTIIVGLNIWSKVEPKVKFQVQELY